MNSLPESVDTLSSNNLDVFVVALHRLESNHEHRFDPVAFCHMTSLVTKARQQRPQVQAILIEKARQQLHLYSQALTETKRKAQQDSAYVTETFTDFVPQAEAYVEQCRYAELTQKVHQLKGSAKYTRERNTAIHYPLRALTDQLSGIDPSVQAYSEKAETSFSEFEEILQQQERDTLIDIQVSHEDANVSAPARANDSLGNEFSCNDSWGTLKASRYLQKTRLKNSANAFIDETIAELPENPGPLNPEMLAIKILMSMRDISPHYLNRSVRYFETLLSLERLTSKKNTAKKKPASK